MRRNTRFFLIFITIVYTLLCFSLPVFAADEPIVVVLDAGHGGHDGGTDTGVRTEKEYNLIIAKYLSEELSADDRFTVVMTRTDDTYLKFLPRAMVALENNADVLISLHCNSNTATYVQGNMAYCSVIDKFDAGVLAGKILDKISDAVPIGRGKIDYVEDTGDSLGVYYWNSDLQWDMPGAWQLGKKSDYYSINTWASKFGIPSIIVEHGYLSNANDASVIEKDENLRAIAKAEAEAIIDYFTGHTHNFTEKTVDFPSNCTLTGTKSHRCTICGMKTGTEALSPAPDGHYWRQSASKANSCEADGYKEFVCQISYNLNDKGYFCDVHSYTENLPATGHNYAVIEDTPSGHGVDGRFVQKCANCSDEIIELREGEPHSYSVTDTVIEDCENDGRIVYTCTVCSDSYEEITTAKGHDWNETEYVPSSPNEEGYRKYTCQICGKEKTEEVALCEHQYNKEVISPTCDENGAETETCTLCGYVKKTAIEALGHDYIKQMDVQSTCTSAGFYKGKCSVCGKVITENRPLLEHSFEEKDGVRICKTCGFEEVSENSKMTFTELLSQPIAIIILALVIVQFAVAGLLFYKNYKRKKDEEERRRQFYGDTETEKHNYKKETTLKK